MPRLLNAALVIGLAHTLPAQTVSATIDSARGHALITVGPLRIPAATSYNHHFAQTPAPFRWPATGWVQGFRIELLDSSGHALPRDMLHHAGITNLDRRQLAYPMAERLLAAGRETGHVALPGSFGIPLSQGQQMLLYYGLANSTTHEIDDVTLRIHMTWKHSGERGPRSIMPIYFDVMPTVGAPGTFPAATGRTETSAEFTLPAAGHLRYLGGHLHDYGVELRLEDAASHRVLARVRADRAEDGRVKGVERTRFYLKRKGLRLVANHRYRVVAVYDNPTCEPVPGAMGVLVAVFVPDDIRSWPAVDTADASYQKDLAWLRSVESTDVGEAHRHGTDSAVTHDSLAAPSPICPGRR